MDCQRLQLFWRHAPVKCDCFRMKSHMLPLDDFVWLVFIFFTLLWDIRVLDNKQLNAAKTCHVSGISSLKATAITLVSI